MSGVRFTVRAREDLLDIWVYVATHGSEAVADSVHHGIDQSCRRLEEHPRLGRARPEIDAEARSIVVERWLVLYRVAAVAVEIVRIIDGARDIYAIEWTPE